MTTIFNVYCDESCHLEHDCQPVMVLGAVWCPLGKAREILVCIREIKTRHDLPPKFELNLNPKRQKLRKERDEYYRMQKPPSRTA